MRTAAMRVRFWGVRGSHPVPGASTVRIGGNSSCVEVEAGSHRLVFDAGTGLIPLGRDLVRRAGRKILHLFISHTHHDHIEGLRFCEPFYQKGWDCRVYGPPHGRETLEQALRGAMQPRYFPVSLDELSARVSIRNLGHGERLRFSGSPPISVEAFHSRAHPKHGVVLYRVRHRGKSIVYATDIEAPRGGHADVVSFARGADLLIHDAQYTEEEYFDGHINKAGWGHSTVRMAAQVAREAGVGRLVLFHHDPSHDDRFVRRMEREARKILPASLAAHEGLELTL
jgi:phosphoribosyl 1,2-cyclic phosphodiesterase